MTAPFTGGDPVPKLTQDDSTLAGLARELLAWHHRGGKVPAGQVIGGEQKMPGGLYGGEFSDPEMQAYNSATSKFHDLQAANQSEHHLNDASNSAMAKATVPADNTAVLLKALGRK